MPGAARMYPETDLPILKISRDLINEVKKTLPKLKEDIEGDLKKKGLSQELIKLVLNGYLDDFEILLKTYSKKPELVAKIITIWRRELATKLKKDIEDVEEIINNDVIGKLLSYVNEKNVDESHIKEILNDLANGIDLKDALKKEKIDFNNLEEKIMKIIKEKPGLSENAYMGLIMKELKGKISGKEAMKIIKKYIK